MNRISQIDTHSMYQRSSLPVQLHHTAHPTTFSIRQEHGSFLRHLLDSSNFPNERDSKVVLPISSFRLQKTRRGVRGHQRRVGDAYAMWTGDEQRTSVATKTLSSETCGMFAWE